MRPLHILQIRAADARLTSIAAARGLTGQHVVPIRLWQAEWRDDVSIGLSGTGGYGTVSA